MQNLIPVVNKLQDVFNAIGNAPIDLPQIVVIGSQSSGKSSVLENVVGSDFLPRGTGIVTRRPLILQLFNTSSPTDGSAEAKAYGEFLHRPNDKIYDFDEIRNEIQRETDRTTGRNKGISTKPISLRIHSPKVLNLTLVDLPGITKVSVGDQPADIEFQIHDMCMQYITNPNAVILAVTAGNTDLANSDALKMAREVDPEGVRTVGVLTKLDLMDPGTDASEMLMNRVIPLRLGYVGVVNRGQRDIENGTKISDAQKKEADFFRNHTAYRHMLHRCGTPTLTRILNHILLHHIRDTLPDIKQRIASLLLEVQAELDALGEPTSDQTQRTLGSQLLQLLSRFCDSFAAAIDGRGGAATNKATLNSQMTELYGGARISYIFNDLFGRSLQGIDPFDGLRDEEIRTVIANAHGTRQSLFVPEISFDLLVKRQIARLEQPGLQCCDLVFDEMQRISTQCETTELSRFPELRDRVMDVMSKLLRRSVSPTQQMISNLIQIELSYINTAHPDFIGGSKAVAQLMESRQPQEYVGELPPTTPPVQMPENLHRNQANRPNSMRQNYAQQNAQSQDSKARSNGQALARSSPSHTPQPSGGIMSLIFGANSSNNVGQATSSATGSQQSPVIKLQQMPDSMSRAEDAPTDRERIETEIIKSLLRSYFDIVRKNYMDLVPKTIMCFLVNKCKSELQNELVASLYKEDELPQLLRETDDVAQRRATCYEFREVLERAARIVNEVRDYNANST
mmetsp:Transcript_1663/g.7259  ORF Transcript_1663/g.7259 Transcript_1663/m.7259 type:complete len:739 (-) Transcript_1663:55-2271(-)